MRLILWLAGSYLLGAVPASYLVARWFGGIDLREHGSRNLGATNLYRTLGWRFAVPAGAFDIAKGAIPVAVFAPRAGDAAWVPILLGLGAVVGHVFSVFVRFRGGKGVATAAGAVLALAPVPLALSAAVWLGVVWLTGYVSLGSLIGAVTFPVAVALLEPQDHYTLAAGVGLAGLIVFTHRSTIRRLLAGQEARFRHRPAAS